jgi:hypothetical protein
MLDDPVFRGVLAFVAMVIAVAAALCVGKQVR